MKTSALPAFVEASAAERLPPTSRESRLSWACAGVLALYVLVYLAPLGARPLLAPDELRYAEIAREMLASGDWVVPHLDGIRYFEKPVLGHWLNALSMQLLGVDPLAVRIPSALAAALTAVALALLVRVATGARRAALSAAVIYLSMLEVYAVGVTAVLDSLLALFTTAASSAFFLACQAESERSRRRWLWSAGVGCGLGLLTKGLVALAIPLVVAVPFLLWERRARSVAMLAWRPLAAAALVVLPWAVWIQVREPDFWRYFICVQHLQRFTSASSGQHPQPLWFLAPFLLAGGLPWTLLLPAAIAGWRARGLSPLGRFSVCGFVGPAVLLSLSDGKLGTYVLPCFAPLALHVALGLEACAAHGAGARAFRAGAGTMALLCGALAGAMLWDRAQAPLTPDLHASLDKLRWPLLALGLAGCSLLAFGASRPRLAAWRAELSAAGSVCLLAAAGWSFPPGTAIPASSVDFVARYAPLVRRGSSVISAPPLAYAASLVLRSDRILLLGRGELGYGLDYPDSAHRLLRDVDVQALVTDARRAQDVAIFTHRDRYEALAALLPEPDVERRSEDLVFALFSRELPVAGRRAGARRGGGERRVAPIAGPSDTGARRAGHEKTQPDPGEAGWTGCEAHVGGGHAVSCRPDPCGAESADCERAALGLRSAERSAPGR